MDLIERYGVIVGRAIDNSGSCLIQIRWADKPKELEWIPVSGLEYSHAIVGVEVEAWREG
jgi:hypothetical protein